MCAIEIILYLCDSTQQHITCAYLAELQLDHSLWCRLRPVAKEGGPERWSKYPPPKEIYMLEQNLK